MGSERAGLARDGLASERLPSRLSPLHRMLSKRLLAPLTLQESSTKESVDCKSPAAKGERRLFRSPLARLRIAAFRAGQNHWNGLDTANFVPHTHA